MSYRGLDKWIEGDNDPHFDMPSARQHQPVPLVCASDDLDELYAERERVVAEREAAERAMRAAGAGNKADWPAYDRAAEDFDAADQVLAMIGNRIEELEEDNAFEALAECRRAYWQRVL